MSSNNIYSIFSSIWKLKIACFSEKNPAKNFKVAYPLFIITVTCGCEILNQLYTNRLRASLSHSSCNVEILAFFIYSVINSFNFCAIIGLHQLVGKYRLNRILIKIDEIDKRLKQYYKKSISVKIFRKLVDVVVTLITCYTILVVIKLLVWQQQQQAGDLILYAILAESGLMKIYSYIWTLFVLMMEIILICIITQYFIILKKNIENKSKKTLSQLSLRIFDVGNLLDEYFGLTMYSTIFYTFGHTLSIIWSRSNPGDSCLVKGTSKIMIQSFTILFVFMVVVGKAHKNVSIMVLNAILLLYYRSSFNSWIHEFTFLKWWIGDETLKTKNS